MNEELLRAQEPGYEYKESPEMLFEEGDEAGNDEEAGEAGSGTDSGAEEGSSSRAESQPSQVDPEETSSDPSEADSSKQSTRVVEFNEDDEILEKK